MLVSRNEVQDIDAIQFHKILLTEHIAICF